MKKKRKRHKHLWSGWYKVLLKRAKYARYCDRGECQSIDFK